MQEDDGDAETAAGGAGSEQEGGSAVEQDPRAKGSREEEESAAVGVRAAVSGEAAAVAEDGDSSREVQGGERSVTEACKRQRT